jgi:hypothetical protein
LINKEEQDAAPLPLVNRFLILEVAVNPLIEAFS